MISRRLSAALLGVGLSAAGPWACRGGSAETGTGGSSSSSSHAASSSSSGRGPAGNVGEPCLEDDDCATGLTCLLPTADDPVLGGGPANGYCSASCANDADCPVDSVCLLPATGPGDCVVTCTLGPPLVSLDDDIATDDKCHGRNDVRCEAVSSSTNVCVPTCGEDDQCPTGRVCDPRLAVCVTTPTAGLPEGSYCDATVLPEACAGVCLTFTGSNAAMCTSPCELGGDPADPTSTPNCGGVTNGLCAFAPASNGAGDDGYCAPACSTQDDCQLPDFWCFAVEGIANGFCFNAVPCPNGDSDCSTISAASCVDTTWGPECLTGDFPLGSAAPDGGAGDGGTGDGGTGDGGAGDGGDGG